MAELLQRVSAALPEIERWIDALHAKYRLHSRVVRDAGFSRLRAVVPDELLAAARFTLVDAVPFPPVASYGLPEFEAMAAMPMAAITFRDMYFVHSACATEDVHLHEIIHVVQWRTLGVRPFLFTYALGTVRFGYRTSPLEAIAFDCQAKFQQGRLTPAIFEAVAQHARLTRAEAATVYAANGIDMGA